MAQKLTAVFNQSSSADPAYIVNFSEFIEALASPQHTYALRNSFWIKLDEEYFSAESQLEPLRPLLKGMAHWGARLSRLSVRSDETGKIQDIFVLENVYSEQLLVIGQDPVSAETAKKLTKLNVSYLEKNTNDLASYIKEFVSKAIIDEINIAYPPQAETLKKMTPAEAFTHMSFLLSAVPPEHLTDDGYIAAGTSLGDMIVKTPGSEDGHLGMIIVPKTDQTDNTWIAEIFKSEDDFSDTPVAPPTAQTNNLGIMKKSAAKKLTTVFNQKKNGERVADLDELLETLASPEHSQTLRDNFWLKFEDDIFPFTGEANYGARLSRLYVHSNKAGRLQSVVVLENESTKQLVVIGDDPVSFEIEKKLRKTKVFYLQRNNDFAASYINGFIEQAAKESPQKIDLLENRAAADTLIRENWCLFGKKRNEPIPDDISLGGLITTNHKTRLHWGKFVVHKV